MGKKGRGGPQVVQGQHGAHKEFKPGDVIMEEMPSVYSLLPQVSKSFCSGCFFNKIWFVDKKTKELTFQDHKLFSCGYCQQFWYCSDPCQMYDWDNFHKFECDIYFKHKDDPDFHKFMTESENAPYSRFALRCWILINRRREELNRSFQLFGLNRALSDLMYYEEGAVVGGIKREQIVEHVLTTLFVSNSATINFQSLNRVLELDKMLCQSYINSFFITDIERARSIGIGLYIGTSMFEHSCAPNAALVFNGLKVQVRAIKKIGQTEQIYLSYLDVWDRRESRMTFLETNYYFECSCSRCAKNDKKDDEMCKECETLYPILAKFNLKERDPNKWKRMFECYERFIWLLEKINGKYQPDVVFHKFSYYTRILVSPDGKRVTRYGEKEILSDMKVTYGLDHPLTKQFIYITGLEAKGREASKFYVSGHF